MKYHYQKPDISVQLYGSTIPLDHPVYKLGTLYSQDGRGLVITQRRFEGKYVYWDAIDPWLANDIYLNLKFPKFFTDNATSENYPIFPVRKVMWALRMKPLPKEFWEDLI